MLKNHALCTQNKKNPNDICEDCFPVKPSFEDWKLDLTGDKLSEHACSFYEEKIGFLQENITQSSAGLYGIAKEKGLYELAKDAEGFILEDIVAGVRFEDEFYYYLKEIYKEAL